MYESPIDLLMSNIQTQIIEEQEEAIYKAVFDIGVNVKNDELIRALKYDRDQYNRGHLDGYADAMASIVRCKDCKHLGFKGLCDGVCNKKMVGIVKPDDFCSYGERRTDV